MSKEKTNRPRLFALCAVVLLIILPLAAGCLSVPGPESPKKTTAVTALATRSAQTTATAATLPPTPAATTARTLAMTTTTAPPTVTSSDTSGYALAACVDQGGFVILPGQKCTGSWLPAINTFSCCSVPPVKGGEDTGTISVAPFTLTVNIDDNLGSISP